MNVENAIERKTKMIDNKPFAMFFNAGPRKVIETASIFTMNIPEKWLDEWKYPQVLESNTQTLKTVFGASESLYACDTYQFTDYSRYDITLFDEAAKRAHRDAQFPIDLANARALGKRLVANAKAHFH